jgi:AcrR family transcriptional regulator
MQPSRKDAIIAAAIREFGENSYDAASINRVIKASGTSKGTFYHYFRGKQDLFAAILADMVRIKTGYYQRMLEQIRDQGTDFFTILKAQAKAGAVFMRENPDLYRFGLQFAKETGPVPQAVVRQFMPELGGQFLQIVQAAIESRSISSCYPADFTARLIWFLSMNYFDILFDKGDEPTPEQIEQRLDTLFDFLKKGLEEKQP